MLKFLYKNEDVLKHMMQSFFVLFLGWIVISMIFPDDRGIYYSLVQAFIFAFLFITVTVSTHVSNLNEIGIEKIKEKHLKAYQKDKVHTDLSFGDIISRIDNSVRFKVISSDAQEGAITVKPRYPYFNSTPKKIFVRNISNEEYEIENIPFFKWMGDFGEGVKNVMDIKHLMQS